MSEILENLIQLLTAGICTAVSAYLAIRYEKREWVLLGLFSGSYFLGDLYWLLFLVFYGETPTNSFIPDMSWYASLLFMFLLLRQTGDWKRPERSPVLFLVPLFTVLNCIYYMRFGGYISNLIYMVLMTLVLWQAAGGLLSIKHKSRQDHNKELYITVILFCALEYCMWTASCLFEGDSAADPYFWFELMLSAAFLLFIPAVRKAVGR